jgi:hypothetical protein
MDHRRCWLDRWLVSTPDGQKQWMNFYTEENGAYERYGYSALEQRWAYGMPPRGANKLLQLDVPELTFFAGIAH